MERRLAAEFALVVGEDGREVDGGDGVEEEVDQVVLGEPVLRRGGEEGGLVGGPLAIGLAHATISPLADLMDHGPRGLFESQPPKAILGQTPSRPSSPAQFRSLFRSLVLDPVLLFGQVFSAEALAVAVACEAGRSCDRIFTPLVTVATFLSQILSDDHSCRGAVARLLAWRAARGLPPCSPDTGAYCKARQRLPESLLPRLVRRTADRLQDHAPEGWLWHGRRVVIADGTCARCPTPRRTSPSTPSTATRPRLRVPDRPGRRPDRAGHRRRSLTPRSARARASCPARARSCVACTGGSPAATSCWGTAVSARISRSLCCRARRRRRVAAEREPAGGLPSGRRLGHDDHLVVWSKPQRQLDEPRAYAAIPETVTIRELRVRVTRRGSGPG